MPALTGLVITAASFNVACFFVDSASVVTVAFGTEGTTLGKVVFPTFPENKALVGLLIITHSSTFTGGTTALIRRPPSMLARWGRVIRPC